MASNHREASRLERLTFWHATLFVIGISWGFGGRIYWMQPPMLVWGSIGIFLTLIGLFERHRCHRSNRWPFLCLLPGIIFVGLVVVSALNPSFSKTVLEGQEVFRPVPVNRWLPSSATPSDSLMGLWLYVGLVLSGFNVALNIEHRHRLHRLVIIMTMNAVAIGIFGTMQKLLGVHSMFGHQASPNGAFFGSFIYHNHWGAFALVHIAALLGLAGPLSRYDQGRGFWHSPAVLALLGALLLAATIPLSTSRSSTVLLLLLIVGATVDIVRRIRNERAGENHSARAATWSLLAGVIAAFAVIYFLAKPQIQQRIRDTSHQLETKGRRTYGEDRLGLYRDTWAIALKKPVFGWGLDSYPLLWQRFNTRPLSTDGPIFLYREAHSDWLQTLAETGFAGALAIFSTWLTPLYLARKRISKEAFPRFLGIGTATITLYAAVEFPFENPAVVLSFWILVFAGLRAAQLRPTSSAEGWV